MRPSRTKPLLGFLIGNAEDYCDNGNVVNGQWSGRYVSPRLFEVPPPPFYKYLRPPDPNQRIPAWLPLRSNV